MVYVRPSSIDNVSIVKTWHLWGSNRESWALQLCRSFSGP